MRKKLQFFLMIILFSNLSFGQGNFWTKTSEEKLKMNEKMDRNVYPSKSQLFHLDFNAFKQLLLSAPMENSSLSSGLVVQFPDYEGNLKQYKVFEAPVMEQELSDKFPTIRSYSAQGIDDPTSTLRFSVTHFGLHVMSLSGEKGTFYIDTFTKDLNNYIVYSRRDVQKARSFGCLVQEELSLVSDRGFDNQVLVNDGNLRQYRLAISNTIEYAAFHLTAAGTPGTATLAQKKAVVLSAMVVSLTRLNGIYEREMAVRMNLVANNDLVIFIDSDNYTNSPDMINEIQPIVDGLIGSANYDMGHGFCTTDSGVAQLASVCGSGKARGITGQINPVGDLFDVDYVAHEMGHQFGANHTQNNACNRAASSSFEPGSASTIMGYAGICAPNVQNNSNDYFHARSILEMTNFVTSASASCRQSSASGNTAPVVSPVANFTIPNGTAFKLTGSATDANGDALTYCWEQYNNDVSTQPPLTTATIGPNFRSVSPSTSPTRYFPKFEDVLNGNLAPTWEVVPTVARTMNFALTVRDNRAGAGMTNRTDMTVTTAAVGPFTVTSPTLNASFDSGATQTITWNVAGTTANGINTANVNILISTDGGATFTTLLANTPNDGSQAVTLPTTLAPYCRILVEAVGNIFYAVSPNFSIGYTVTQTTICTDYTRTFSPPVAMQTGWAGYGIPAPGVAITDDYTITDVDFKVVCTAARTNQVSFGLVKPGSSVVDVVVFDGPTSGCANNRANLDAIFDDEGVAFDCAATATGARYRPTASLTSLDGLNSAGTWRFAAKSTLTTNTISSVILTLCRVETVVTLNSNSFGLQDFSLYPNPNNGNFTIQFNSNSGNEIKVNVYDMRGREIFNKTYPNDGFFNEDLQLSNVESGVYLVNVQDGNSKEVKKIVVK